MPLIVAAILSGACFAVIGVGYYVGAKHRVAMPYVGCVMLVTGLLFFGGRASFVPYQQSPLLYIVSAASGTSLFLCYLLMQKAVKIGLLSSMWIALNLNFVPQALFCALRYHEKMGVSRWIGLSLGVLCILVLSRQQAVGAGRNDNTAPSGSHSRLRCFFILAGMLIVNSVFLTGTKVLSYHSLPEGVNLWTRGGDFFYCLSYAVGVVFCLPYLLLRLPYREQFKPALISGLIGSAGAISGLGFISYCVSHRMSGTLCFPLSSITSIFGGSLAGILFFNEKPTPYFYAGNALAAASILMFLV